MSFPADGCVLTRSRRVFYRTSAVHELPSPLLHLLWWHMHHRTKLSFVDEFRWVSPLHYLKIGWQNTVLRWCMLQAGPSSLHYYCAVVLHSCILLPHVGHSSKHVNLQLTRQSSCVSNLSHFPCFHLTLSRIYTHQQLHCNQIQLYRNVWYKLPKCW